MNFNNFIERVKNYAKKLHNDWKNYCGSTKIYLILSIVIFIFTYYKMFSMLVYFKNLTGSKSSISTVFKCIGLILVIFLLIRIFDIYVFTHFIEYTCNKNKKVSYVLSVKPIVDSVLFIILIYVLSKIKGAVEIFTNF